MASTVPHPRGPLDGAARWYEHEFGWAALEGPPLRLRTGLRFDVLEMPAGAGAAVLRRIGRTGPVALSGDRRLLRFLVAAGSAEEVPGLLSWLEWGGVELALTALGAGGLMRAPTPPRWPYAAAQGAAVWVRPPEPGREVVPALPVLAPFGDGARSGGRGGGAPDLVRLVDAAATECHRARLLSCGDIRANGQPLAFS